MKTQEVSSIDEFEARLSLTTTTSNPDFARQIFGPVMEQPRQTGRFFDLITIVLDGNEGKNQLGLKLKDGKTHTGGFKEFTLKVPTNFFTYDEGVLCEVGGQAMALSIAETMKAELEKEGSNWAEWRAWLDQSNLDFGLEPSPAVVKLLADTARRGETQTAFRFPANEGITMLPNSAGDRDVHRSLMAYPHQWPIDQNLCLRAFDGHENTVVYQPSEVEKLLRDAPQKALELLEKRFGEIKNETVPDVIDILFHHWHRHHDPKTNASLITAALICKYRGVLPKGANLDLHWRALQDAFSMSLRERNGDINAKVFFSEISGEKLGAGAAYAYSPGFMLQYALRGETLYFAPFMEKIWALDPKKNNESKRIARYMRGDWRMNTEKYLTAESGAARAARYHTWAHILSESGIDVETHRQSKDPKRLIEAVAKAVETLYQMEVLDETGFDIYHRDDRKAAEDLPPRGALDAWLALRVCLAPAASVREALLETDGKRRAGRARDAKALSTERAKKALKANPKRPKR